MHVAAHALTGRNSIVQEAEEMAKRKAATAKGQPWPLFFQRLLWAWLSPKSVQNTTILALLVIAAPYVWKDVIKPASDSIIHNTAVLAKTNVVLAEMLDSKKLDQGKLEAFETAIGILTESMNDLNRKLDERK